MAESEVRGPPQLEPPDRRTNRALRRRAYRELGKALEMAGRELQHDWVLAGDKDLKSLRDLNEPEWQRFVHRYSDNKEESSRISEFPQPARGDARSRANHSLVFAVLAWLAVAALVRIDGDWGAVAMIPALAVSFIAMRRHRDARKADRRSIQARRKAATAASAARGAPPN